MFAVVHCPDFYVQCERIFRPELNDQALIITSSDGSGGSIVVASSIEAQHLGLVSGLEGAQLANALEEPTTNNAITVIRPNYELYADLSTRFLKSLSLLAPKVSAYASNEAFLDLEGLKPKEGLDAFAHQLRRTLKQWLGVSAFIGVAPTKTLAKLASNAAQTFKQYQGAIDISESEKIHQLLAQVPVSEVNGISKKAASKLSEMNVHTALELSKAQKSQVRRRSSVVIERIALELSGLRCKELDVNTGAKNINSIASDQTEMRTFTQAKQALKAQVIEAQKQLQSLKCVCERVTISLAIAPLNQGDSPFQNTLSADLVKVTDSLSAISRLATQVLESLWCENRRYLSLTLSLEGLSLSVSKQFALFSSPVSCSENSTEFSPPTAINIEALLCNSLSAENANIWRDRRSLLSPSFTTKWGDIPRVN